VPTAWASTGWPPWEAVTTGLVYVRLHGHERTYASPYTADQLGRWTRPSAPTRVHGSRSRPGS